MWNPKKYFVKKSRFSLKVIDHIDPEDRQEFLLSASRNAENIRKNLVSSYLKRNQPIEVDLSGYNRWGCIFMWDLFARLVTEDGYSDKKLRKLLSITHNEMPMYEKLGWMYICRPDQYGNLKIYLDDERPTPDGWLGVRWPDEVIALIKDGCSSEVSLDHDLGDDDRGTGYDVVKWIEEAVYTKSFTPPDVKVHSANSSARQKMELGIANISKKHLENIKTRRENAFRNRH